MTLEQLKAIPDGTMVRVIWDGGNGPHLYPLKRDANGNPCVVKPSGVLERLSPSDSVTVVP